MNNLIEAPAPSSRDEIRSRRLSTEEMIRVQLDRINLIRSNVQDPNRIVAWSEAVEALADMLLPWANDAQDKGRFLQEWEDRPVAVVKVPLPGGVHRLVPVPNASDAREAQLICIRLLDRHGLLLKRRTVSGPAPRFQKEEAEEDEGPQVPM